MNKILIINTGGTIGMINSDKGNSKSPLIPAKSWEDISSNFPMLNSYNVDLIQLNKLVDSSDIDSKTWIKLADLISENYDKYSGFIILHGTDTMSYTASALSFMLKNLAKPVILTGAQIPLQDPRSDGSQNLISSLEIALNKEYIVPEVCIFFRDFLIRGNRARKLDAKNYQAFDSPNFPYLCQVGGSFSFNKKYIKKIPKEDFFINTDLDTNIMVLELFPGFDPNILKNIFINNSNIKGLVLKTFGNGNGPSSDIFLNTIKDITNKGVVVVNISQCPVGTVKLGLYQASSGLLDSGVISGIDMTPEGAVTKLMYLLAKNWNVQEVKRMMQQDIAGELSQNHYQINVANLSKIEKKANYSLKIPGEINFTKLMDSIIHLRKISFKKTQNEKLIIKFFIDLTKANIQCSRNEKRCLAYFERDIKDFPMDSQVNFHVIVDIQSKIRTLCKEGHMSNLTIVSNENIEVKEININISTDV